jgi:HlyD family secretion protein
MSAEANFQNAKLTREIAEIAVVEYVEGLLASETAEIQGEVKLGAAELDLAEAELEAAKAIVGDNKLQIKRAQLARSRAKFAVEKGLSRLRILKDYTSPKRKRELQSEVEKTRSIELAKKATWELEISKERKLERQIAACEIRAPSDGTLVYANPADGRRRLIEEGATVRERQLLFEIVPDSGAKPKANEEPKN